MSEITRLNCDKILTIEGMMCPHCVKHVSQALNDMDKVEANVSLENNEAYVNVFTKKITDEMLKEAVKEAGYEVTSIVINHKYNEADFDKVMTITDMMCKNCQKHVSEALNAIEGVEAVVSVYDDKAYIKGNVSDDVLTKAVEEADYTVGQIYASRP